MSPWVGGLVQWSAEILFQNRDPATVGFVSHVTVRSVTGIDVRGPELKQWRITRVHGFDKHRSPTFSGGPKLQRPCDPPKVVANRTKLTERKSCEYSVDAFKAFFGANFEICHRTTGLTSLPSRTRKPVGLSRWYCRQLTERSWRLATLHGDGWCFFSRTRHDNSRRVFSIIRQTWQRTTKEQFNHGTSPVSSRCAISSNQIKRNFIARKKQIS